MKLLCVMIGGFFGAVSRYTLGEWFQSQNAFPLGTLCINLIGCLLLGWFLTFISQKAIVKPEFTLFISTGLIGSFTTFSTFSVETIQLFQENLIFVGILYILLSIILGLLLVYVGHKLAKFHKKEGNAI